MPQLKSKELQSQVQPENVSEKTGEISETSQLRSIKNSSLDLQISPL